MSLPVSAAPAFVPDMPFNLDRDFAPLIKVAGLLQCAGGQSRTCRSTRCPIWSALLKSKPDQLTFSSGGYGTPAHLIGELFEQRTGTHAIHVPYQQFPQAIGDLISGTNQYMFVAMLPVVDLIKSGKLRALAVTAPKRVPTLADVPSIVEEGYPDLVVEDWTGFDVKSGTPSDDDQHPQFGDQYGADQAERSRGIRQSRRHTGRRHTGCLRRIRQIGNDALGAGRQRRWG